MRITVVGLGKIGLPLAVQFASKGYDVVGLDIDQKTVDTINSGNEPFPEEENLQEKLNQVVLTGKLRATTIAKQALEQATHIVVVVPLFVDSQALPDFNSIDQATSEIGKYIRPGTLVAYETTLPVGTTRDRFVKNIASSAGLIPGKDFFAVFSPERVLTGRIFSDLKKYPKIVGGIDAESTKRGVEFYSRVLDFDANSNFSQPNGVWEVANCEAAEMVKLAETTYRDVNIGLANQFAKYASQHNIDIHEVISGANSQPFSNIHAPGVAVGGHCIPIYPHFFLHNSPEASIVSEARAVNKGMPKFFVDRLEELIGNFAGKNILVLGLSYREKVKEHAFSGTFDLVLEIEYRGAAAFVADPLYSEEEIIKLGLKVNYDNSQIDAIVLHTKHDVFKNIDFSEWPRLSAIIDGRAFLDEKKIPDKVKFFSF